MRRLATRHVHPVLAALTRSRSGLVGWLIVLATLAATVLPVSHVYVHLHADEQATAGCMAADEGSPAAGDNGGEACTGGRLAHPEHCPHCLQLAQAVLPTPDFPLPRPEAGHGGVVPSLLHLPPTSRPAWLRPAPRAPPPRFS